MLENYKDAVIRHQDPSYVTNLLKTPMIAGNTLFSTCCCHYYFIKSLLNPFMSTANTVKIGINASSECLKSSRSKLNLGDLLTNTSDVPREDSRFEDDPSRMRNENRSISLRTLLNAATIIRIADIFASIVAYTIVIILIAASFYL